MSFVNTWSRMICRNHNKNFTGESIFFKSVPKNLSSISSIFFIFTYCISIMTKFIWSFQDEHKLHFLFPWILQQLLLFLHSQLVHLLLYASHFKNILICQVSTGISTIHEKFIEYFFIYCWSTFGYLFPASRK